MSTPVAVNIFRSGIIKTWHVLVWTLVIAGNKGPFQSSGEMCRCQVDAVPCEQQLRGLMGAKVGRKNCISWMLSFIRHNLVTLVKLTFTYYHGLFKSQKSLTSTY